MMMPGCLRRKGRNARRGNMTARPENAAIARLRGAGLQADAAARALAGLLFRHGGRHVSAEALHDEAAGAGFEVSLATVYNTLHQFTGRACCSRSWSMQRAAISTPMSASTSISTVRKAKPDRYSCGAIAIAGLPTPPRGMEVERVDVIVRLKRS